MSGPYALPTPPSSLGLTPWFPIFASEIWRLLMRLARVEEGAMTKCSAERVYSATAWHFAKYRDPETRESMEGLLKMFRDHPRRSAGDAARAGEWTEPCGREWTFP